MSEKNVIFANDILKKTINIYFDTFFVFYFFKVANYEIIPLAKYYLTQYLFLGIGFFLIRNSIKRNIKVPYFRIGIAMQALYISLIMVLKEQIINYVYLVAIVKGLSDGFYYFPKNLLDTEKIDNENRQKFGGIIDIIIKLISILVPLILGVLLTLFSYVDIGKIFFLLFILMFIISFKLKDLYYSKEMFNFSDFKKIIKNSKNIRYALIITFLSGLTYSSGVMGLIVTLSKINNFQSNLNLGIVDSVCNILALLITTIYALKLSKKHFSTILNISSIISFISLILFAFFKTRLVLIIYLIVRFSCILIINLISNLTVVNLSNSEVLKKEYKPEFYFAREITFSIARCTGYALLLIICIFIGMDYINLLMILCALAIFAEGLIVSMLCKSN